METSDAGCWRGWGFGFDPFFSSDGDLGQGEEEEATVACLIADGGDD
jgi:hypothetical protein